METSDAYGLHGERAFMALCRQRGINVLPRRRMCPYDFLVEGLRIEFKIASPQTRYGKLVWRFNFHRHGVLKEKCDFYILCMEGIPNYKARVYLLLKAPVKKKGISVSVRSLLQKYAIFAVDFENFMRMESKRRKSTIKRRWCVWIRLRIDSRWGNWRLVETFETCRLARDSICGSPCNSHMALPEGRAPKD
jgi:hypothetical protein